MKKSLFGYDVDEVNQNIEYYESQLETLTAKVSNLHAVIVSKDEIIKNLDNTSNKSVDVDVDVSSFKKKIATLESINKMSEDKNTELVNENENLKKQVAELKQISKGINDITEVGKICKEAYSDMALVKKKTRDAIGDYIGGFVEVTDGHNQEISAAIEEIKLARELAQDSFINSVEDILNKFNEMSATNDVLETALKNLAKTKNSIFDSVNEYLKIPEHSSEETNEKMEEEIEEESTLTPLLYKALCTKKNGCAKKNVKDKVVPPLKEEATDHYKEDKESVPNKASGGLENVKLSIIEQ